MVGVGDSFRMTFVVTDPVVKGYKYLGVCFRVYYTNVDGAERFYSAIDVSEGTSGTYLVRDVNSEGEISFTVRRAE